MTRTSETSTKVLIVAATALCFLLCPPLCYGSTELNEEEKQVLAAFMSNERLPHGPGEWQTVGQLLALQEIDREQTKYRAFCRAAWEQGKALTEEGADKAAANAYHLARLFSSGKENFLGKDELLALAKKLPADQDDAPWAWHALAFAHYRVGDYDEAIRNAKKSLKYGWGGDVLNWQLLSLAMMKQGQEKKARNWGNLSAQWYICNVLEDKIVDLHPHDEFQFLILSRTDVKKFFQLK